MITSTTTTSSMNNNAIIGTGSGTSPIGGTSPTGNNNSNATTKVTGSSDEALRQEINLLKSQLRKVSGEKYRYEQTFRSIQDRVRSDVESSLYLQAQSYEARLTELHSVIGVLKRRVEDAEGRRILEVDERSATVADDEEEDEDPNDDDDNDNGESYCGESVDEEPAPVPVPSVKRPTPTRDDPHKSHGDTRAASTSTGVRPGGAVLIDPSPSKPSTSTNSKPNEANDNHKHHGGVNKDPRPSGPSKSAPTPAPRAPRAGSPRPPGAPDLAQFHSEIQKIRTEHLRIKHSLRDKEKELVTSRWTIQNLNHEKNYMQEKIRELEESLNRVVLAKSAAASNSSPCPRRRRSNSGQSDNENLQPGIVPVTTCKMASKIPLPRNVKHNNNPHGPHQPPITPVILTGPQITSVTNTLNNNLPGTAARVLTDQISLDAATAELRDRNEEKDLEIERLHYALQNALAENEVLQLNLQDGKDVAESLTLLLGKYESRFVTMELLNEYNSQLIESYDVLVALLESELGQLLANCRAVGIGSSDSCCSSGIGSSGSPIESDELLEIATLLQRANENRAVAESAAGSLLGRMIGDDASPVSQGASKLERGSHACGSVELFENPLSSPEEESVPDSGRWEDTMSSTQSQSQSHSTSSPTDARTCHPNNHPPGSVHAMTNTNTTTGTTIGTAPASTMTMTMTTTPVNYSSIQQLALQLQHPFTKSELDKQTESRVRSLIIQLKTRQEALRSTLQDMEPPSWSVAEINASASIQKTKPAPSDADSCIESRRNDLEIAILMQELMALKEERAELRGQISYMEKERKRVQVGAERMNLKEIGYQAQIQLLTSQCQMAQSQSQPNDTMNNNNGSTNTQINQLISTMNQLNESQYQVEAEYKAQLIELATSNRTLLQNLHSSKSRYEKRVRKMEEQIVAIMERHVEQIREYKDKMRRLEAGEGQRKAC